MKKIKKGLEYSLIFHVKNFHEFSSKFLFDFKKNFPLFSGLFQEITWKFQTNYRKTPLLIPSTTYFFSFNSYFGPGLPSKKIFF